MTDKLLSIITPTKNCVHTIESTFKSVQMTKSDEVEYIIVDGVSDDGTLKIIEKYSSMIDHFICEPDTGIYNAMNKGVVRASGDFILFINGDDELIPDGVQKVLGILRGGDEQIVCATTIVSGDESNSTFFYVPDPQRLIYGLSLPHPSSFVKRELLIQFPFREDLTIASDYDFFLRAFLSGIAFRTTPYQSAVHHLGGVSSDHNKRVHEVNLVLKDHLGWWRPIFYKVTDIFRRGMRKITKQFKSRKTT